MYIYPLSSVRPIGLFYKKIFLGVRTNFTQGGVCGFRLDNLEGSISKGEKDVIACREGFYGWMGFGGSIFQVSSIHNILILICSQFDLDLYIFQAIICKIIYFQWHPELNIGFGYIPTNLHWWEFNVMSGRLQTAVIKCVKELKQ